MKTFHSASPVGFAHRGGRAHYPENTLPAFKNALNIGVSGIETDAWLTSDSQIVLAHGGVIRSILRPWGRTIKRISHGNLPHRIPTLAQLCELLSPEHYLQIDVKDDDAAGEIVNVYRNFFPESMDHLWLAHAGHNESDWGLVASWRALDGDIGLVDSTNTGRIDVPIHDYAQRAADAGIDAINLPGSQWKPALIDAVHDARIMCFGFNVQSEQLIQKLVGMNIDAIYSDHADRLMKVLGADR